MKAKQMEITNEWFGGYLLWVVYDKGGVLRGLFNRRGSAKRYVIANG
jgi:hypothetical protein